MLFLSNLAQSENYEKLQGEWRCGDFVIKNEYFRVTVKSKVKFRLPDSITSQVQHLYDYGDDKKIVVNLVLYGVWGMEGKRFWDMISGFKTSIEKNNTEIDNKQIEEFAMSYFSKHKKTYSEIEFLSNDRFLWKKGADIKDISCARIKKSA